MSIIDDYKIIYSQDPAARRGFWGFLEILFTFAGFHAVVIYRIAHFIHKMNIPFFPRLFSHFGRLITGAEIHPAAEIGKCFFIDHAFGVVVGETTIIGDNVTLFQGVTLGGTGKQVGKKRHPTIGNNVVIGAGSIILGNITIGDGARVGAGTTVVKPVPPDSTVVGVAGMVVKCDGRRLPCYQLDYSRLPNPVIERIEQIQKEIEEMEDHMRCLRVKKDKIHNEISGS